MTAIIDGTGSIGAAIGPFLAGALSARRYCTAYCTVLYCTVLHCTNRFQLGPGVRHADGRGRDGSPVPPQARHARGHQEQRLQEVKTLIFDCIDSKENFSCPLIFMLQF